MWKAAPSAHPQKSATWASFWTLPSHSSHTSNTSPDLLSATSKTSPDSSRPSLSNSVAENLIHAFITSCLDYCNGVLSWVPSKALDRLQYVQKALAAHHSHPHPPSLAPGQVLYLLQSPPSHLQIHLCPYPSTYQTSSSPIPRPGICGPQTGVYPPPPTSACGLLGTGPSVWQPQPFGTLSRQRSATLHL